MKKLMLVMLMGAIGTATMAQTKEVEHEKNEKKVTPPAAVKTAFAKDFPGKEAKAWEAEHGGFEVEFKMDGVDASAVYDKTGHRKETEVSIKTSELPAAATEYIKKNHASQMITEAAKITNDKNVVTYEAEVGKDGKNIDLIFDTNGKFIKQSKED